MDTKIALITGATRGIGRAIALKLAKEGYHIVANYRSSKKDADSLSEEIKTLGGKCYLYPFDISEHEQVEASIEKILAEVGLPDVLVNNAGIAKDGLMMFMENSDWTDVCRTSLEGFFFVTKPILKGMLRRRSGSIINLSSVSGVIGNAGQVNYSAAKGGLISATKALAKEVAKRNIRVNCVAPGFIETDMTSEIPKDQIKQIVPMQRIGQANEVASLVKFLASNEASYITGQVIGVNGGIC